MVKSAKVKQLGEEGHSSFELDGETRITDLLDSIGKNPEEVVVKRNEKIVSKEEKVKNGDIIVIVPIISGG